jgi:hypothetical protein
LKITGGGVTMLGHGSISSMGSMGLIYGVLRNTVKTMWALKTTFDEGRPIAEAIPLFEEESAGPIPQSPPSSEGDEVRMNVH